MPFTITAVASRVSFFINFDGPNPPSKQEWGVNVTAELVDIQNDRLAIDVYDPDDNDHGTMCFKLDPTAPVGEQLVFDDANSHPDFAINMLESINTGLTDKDGRPTQTPLSAWRLFLPTDVCREEGTAWFVCTSGGCDVEYTPLDPNIKSEDDTVLSLDPIVQITGIRSCTVAEISSSNPA